MGATIERRLASFRAARSSMAPTSSSRLARAGTAAAERLAAEVDGELVRTPAGAFVRLEGRGEVIPVDRARLAHLPGQPPEDVPLVCLDTETTGLATAAGTLAFLVGLGWWEGSRFRQVQLLLPDHAFEPALLEELHGQIPHDAWLVTYNGRTFDWPLLVTRFRMARRDAPRHAGHLDLLPLVRRVFRHRLPDARLRSVETHLLGVHRTGDVEGWEIPGRYFGFLDGGPATPLIDVLRHNDTDVRSLALLVGLMERQLGDVEARAGAPPGDLAGLARAFVRERRLEEALHCLDAALAGPPSPSPTEWRDPFGRTPPPAVPDPDELGWTTPTRRADFGGPIARREASPWPGLRSLVAAQPWTSDRIEADRARILRRLGRNREAEAAWHAVADRGGVAALHAWIEVAKIREHRLGDITGALEATRSAARIVGRQPLGGLGLRRLERAIRAREVRLAERLLRAPRPPVAPDAADRAGRPVPTEVVPTGVAPAVVRTGGAPVSAGEAPGSPGAPARRCRRSAALGSRAVGPA